MELPAVVELTIVSLVMITFLLVATVVAVEEAGTGLACACTAIDKFSGDGIRRRGEVFSLRMMVS
jgi:hypothetical protein